MDRYTYQIDPRPSELGGGWRLSLLDCGEEVGGGVFPPDTDTEQGKDYKTLLNEAFADAQALGEDWLANQVPRN